jgi:HlyD family secretion protein
MKSNKWLRNSIIGVLVIAIAVYAGWYYFIRPNTIANEQLSASGTVETTEISVVPQQSGKIVEVDVNEGDVVKTGQVLYRLDNTLLEAQRNAASSSVEVARAASNTSQIMVASAQAQYDSTLISVLNADKANRIQDWKKEKPSEFDQPNWFYDKSEQVSAAKLELESATTFLKKAEEDLAFVSQKNGGVDFITVENRLALARIAFQNVNDVLDRAANANNGQDLKDQAQDIYDNTKTELNLAQDAYDKAITSKEADEIQLARAKVQVARERVDSIQDRLRGFETGIDSPQLKAAQLVLDQARSNALQSDSVVKQAQTNLDLIDTQISLNTITSPIDGIVLTRNAELGSAVSPGGVMLTLGTLNELTITVYVPEDRVGDVSLGQSATVTVDSFPGRTFSASVKYISSQAEFTPRNVETVAGRKNTVFAVKLMLDNTAGVLKPGMPADVVFLK